MNIWIVSVLDYDEWCCGHLCAIFCELFLIFVKEKNLLLGLEDVSVFLTLLILCYKWLQISIVWLLEQLDLPFIVMHILLTLEQDRFKLHKCTRVDFFSSVDVLPVYDLWLVEYSVTETMRDWGQAVGYTWIFNCRWLSVFILLLRVNCMRLRAQLYLINEIDYHS